MESKTNQELAGQILSVYGVDLIKSEGDRGGKVIGHTKSGHPIYEHFDHPAHKNFSSFEHHDAYMAHLNRSENNEAQQHKAQVRMKSNTQSTGSHIADHQPKDFDGHRQLKHGDEITRTSNPSEARKWGEDKSKPIIQGHKPGDYKDFSKKNHKEAAEIHEKLGNHELANQHREVAEGMKKSDGESELLRDFHGKGEFDADGLEPTKIVKAEGDHGGVIIGHTGSGKPIYQDHNHPSHSSFTRNDHLDAAAAHEVKRKQHFNNTLAVDKKVAELPDHHLFTAEHHDPLIAEEKHEWQSHKDRKESTDHHLRQALNS